MIKRFHISDVLSVTTEKTLSPSFLDVVDHIVATNGVTGVGACANKLAVQDFLKTALPWTQDVSFPDIPETAPGSEHERISRDFIEQAAAKYGEFHDVPQMDCPPSFSLIGDLSYISRVLG